MKRIIKLLCFILAIVLSVSLFSVCGITAAAETAAPKVYMRYPNGVSKAFTMSFDDARKNDARFISSFQNYGLKATFFISTGLLGTSSSLYASLDDAVAAYSNKGMEIASHTVNHKDLPTVYAEQGTDGLTAEITADVEALENAFGTKVYGLAYPGAPPYKVTDDNVINFLKDIGVGFARTAGSSNNFDIPTDWYRWTATTWVGAKADVISFGESFVNAKANAEPMLYYIWGHAYDIDIDNNWTSYSEFDAFAQSMSGKDDIWYATNGDIYNYITDYNKMTVSYNGNIITNPTNRDLWFSLNGATYKIAAGETIEGLVDGTKWVEETKTTVNVTVGENTKTIDVIISGKSNDAFVNPTVSFTEDGAAAVLVTDYVYNGKNLKFSYTTANDVNVDIQFTAAYGDDKNYTTEVIPCNLKKFAGIIGAKYVLYSKLDLGDANKDSVTDVKDLVRTKKIIVDLEALTDAADIGGDGKVTTEDLVAIAKYIIAGKTGLQACTVTYVDTDNTVLETVLVPAGFAAKATVIPTKTDYVFAGWDKAATAVSQDITVMATYKESAEGDFNADDLSGNMPGGWEYGD